MGAEDPHHLGDDDREAVLGRGGVGVLSFSTSADESPHSVPVSYGYDAETDALYFRLAVGGDSAKLELLDNPATFVVYQEGDDGYESVVAQGELDSIAEADVSTDALDGLSRVDIPLFDVFERDVREVEFDFYRLSATDVTGKR
jgi:hypothetical protein